MIILNSVSSFIFWPSEGEKARELHKMDIYKNKSRWKWLLAIMGLLIIIFTILYSKYLADNLKEITRETVEVYKEAIISAKQGDGDASLVLQITTKFSDVPIVMENEQGVLTGYNYEEGTTNHDQDFLQKMKIACLKSGNEPIEGSDYYYRIYFDNSKLYKRIALFPLVQILLLSTFVLFGYYVFSTSRKAEQNRVWAGMAKETAHQLGTPISAILGWIEHLKESAAGNEYQQEIVTELRNDVTRLELIADRFSKIGSKPKLEKVNIIEELNDCRDYMQRRASKKITFDYPAVTTEPIYAKMNCHLFDWVVENILRNALDSMEGKGKISATVQKEGTYVTINLSDTGKGIPANKFKTVFEPGYTTKKRGWGLGLSLAKRIIEEYHSGKIFVKNSKPNEGTTFTIQLPLA